MRLILLMVSAAMVAILAATPVRAQTPAGPSEGQAARARGAAALAARDFAGAETAYVEVLEIERQAGPGSDALGEALYALAYAKSRTPGDDAFALWAEALAVFEANGNWARAAATAGAAATDHGNAADAAEAMRLARLGVAHAERSGQAAVRGQALRVLGMILGEAGDYAEAEAVLEPSLVLLGGPTADAAAPVLDELGFVYQATHRYDRAGTVLGQAVTLKERLNGPGSYPVALSLNALAMLRDAQGRTAEAETLYRRAMRLAETNGRAAAAAAIRSNLGWAIQQQGRYAEAEPLLRQAAEAAETSLGRNHEDAASAWANLAGNLQDQGRHAEAAAILKDAVARYEATVGRDHLLTAWSLNALARSTAALDGEAAAGPLYAEALAISEARLSPGHPDRVRRANDMAEHWLVQARPDAAMPLIRTTGIAVRARLDTARLGGERAPALDRGRRVFGLQVRGAWVLAH